VGSQSTTGARKKKGAERRSPDALSESSRLSKTWVQKRWAAAGRSLRRHLDPDTLLYRVRCEAVPSQGGWSQTRFSVLSHT
jgi:hypothetical protein